MPNPITVAQVRKHEAWVNNCVGNHERVLGTGDPAKCISISLSYLENKNPRHVHAVPLDGGKARTAQEIIRVLHGYAYSKVEDFPGRQEFVLVAHYDDEKDPIEQPFAFDVAPHQTGTVSERPDAEGRLQQDMRHKEYAVQTWVSGARDNQQASAVMMSAMLAHNTSLQEANQRLNDSLLDHQRKLLLANNEHEEKKMKEQRMAMLLQLGFSAVLSPLANKLLGPLAAQLPSLMGGGMPDLSQLGQGATEGEEEEGSDEAEFEPTPAHAARPQPAPSRSAPVPPIHDAATDPDPIADPPPPPQGIRTGKKTLNLHPDTVIILKMAQQFVSPEDRQALGQLATMAPHLFQPLMARFFTVPMPIPDMYGQPGDTIILNRLAQGAMGDIQTYLPILQPVMERHQEFGQVLMARLVAATEADTVPDLKGGKS